MSGDKPGPKVAVNNTYTVKIGSPLLRPGVELSTAVSEKYVTSAVRKLMELVREINT